MIPQEPIVVGFKTGKTLYAHRKVGGTRLNVNTNAYQAYNEANWAQYVISLDEEGGSGVYESGTPPAVVAAKLPIDVIYEQMGGSPAVGDPIRSIINAEGVNVAAINSLLSAAEKLGKANDSIQLGAAVAGTLTIAQMTTDLTNVVNGAYIGRALIWLTGNLAGTAAAITGYNGTTKLLQFTAVPVAPQIGDAFIIV